MQKFSQMPRMDVWYSRLTAQDIIDSGAAKVDKSYRKAFEKQVARRRRRPASAPCRNWTTTDAEGNISFLSNPPFMEPFDEVVGHGGSRRIPARGAGALVDYRRSLISDRRVLFSGYRVVDLARKVVGVGSVGTRCWVMLLMADQDESDVLMLQLKAQASVLEAYLGHRGPTITAAGSSRGNGSCRRPPTSCWAGPGHDSGSGDGLLRPPDVGLEESADIPTMDATSLEIYAHLCGWTSPALTAAPVTGSRWPVIWARATPWTRS